ncbi:hypothetical protein IBL26_06000 [Roseomonas aerophila]|uniref:Uncharacterized protein n=1 Tax=Teichococcus aerophilus TaxID=1224513 RepID=A0ABR7RJ90_9PROT|nr:hypothetical protein [Pseudoroseomonas aerophila]MBC9206381.1 hypothetical protein [Pseudoroseomonas aerophila]
MVEQDKASAIAAANQREVERAAKSGRKASRRQRVGEALDTVNDVSTFAEILWTVGRGIGAVGRIVMKLARFDH